MRPSAAPSGRGSAWRTAPGGCSASPNSRRCTWRRADGSAARERADLLRECGRRRKGGHELAHARAGLAHAGQALRVAEHGEGRLGQAFSGDVLLEELREDRLAFGALRPGPTGASLAFGSLRALRACV